MGSSISALESPVQMKWVHTYKRSSNHPGFLLEEVGWRIEGDFGVAKRLVAALHLLRVFSYFLTKFGMVHRELLIRQRSSIDEIAYIFIVVWINRHVVSISLKNSFIIDEAFTKMNLLLVTVQIINLLNKIFIWNFKTHKRSTHVIYVNFKILMNFAHIRQYRGGAKSMDTPG